MWFFLQFQGFDTCVNQNILKIWRGLKNVWYYLDVNLCRNGSSMGQTELKLYTYRPHSSDIMYVVSSVCLSIWVCGTYIVHHCNGAPPTCILHHRASLLCTMVHKRDQIFVRLSVLSCLNTPKTLWGINPMGLSKCLHLSSRSFFNLIDWMVSHFGKYICGAHNCPWLGIWQQNDSFKISIFWPNYMLRWYKIFPELPFEGLVFLMKGRTH